METWGQPQISLLRYKVSDVETRVMQAQFAAELQTTKVA